jgi:uncharacterized MAPEG superfamily protein
MNETALSLIGYIAWVLILMVGIVVVRLSATLSTGKAANSFQPDGGDVSAFSGRLCRAHANACESFPIVGGVLIVALATNQAVQVTDSLALIVLGSRVAQSIVHLISTSVVAVQLRFAFFLVQCGIAGYWIVQMVARLVA